MANILKFSAQFFSFIFNPFIIPSFGFLILFYNMPSTEFFSARMRNILSAIVFISSFVMPIIFIMLLSTLSKINQNMMHHSDRIFPYIFSAFSVFMGARLLSQLPIPNIFSLYMTGAGITLIMLFLITTKWKISGHASGMGGLLGLLLATAFKYNVNLTLYIILTIVISGIIGSSRIYLNKHTPWQVYAGYVGSMSILFTTVYFY
jgi:membrane-associated phospholipid phosphatase